MDPAADGVVPSPEPIAIDWLGEQAPANDVADLLSPTHWRLPESAWVETPVEGSERDVIRVLVSESYEQHPTRKPYVERKRNPAHTIPWAGGQDSLKATIERMIAGGKRGNIRATEKSKERILRWLEDPKTHRYGDRELVSMELYPPISGSGPWRLKVRCTCGEEQLVPGPAFCQKLTNCGRMCRRCSLSLARREGLPAPTARHSADSEWIKPL